MVDFNISVPMLDGSQVKIEHAAVDMAKETLGIWISPVGDSKAALENMQNKADECIAREKVGTLSRSNVCFLLDRQLWPRVGYIPSSNTLYWQNLTDCIKKQWCQLIPLGGVIRNDPARVRQTSHIVYGVGFPHVVVECFVEQSNKVLMHYGCP